MLLRCFIHDWTWSCLPRSKVQVVNVDAESRVAFIAEKFVTISSLGCL
jgi:hypothetical protein